MTEPTTASFPLSHGGITLTTRHQHQVRVRHIVPEDAALLIDLFNNLSPETRRLRFFRPVADLPDSVLWPEARRLADIDPLSEAALIATIEEQQERAIGVARLINDDSQPDTAEVAIVLRDDFQAEGLGTLLFDLLLQVAMVRGLKRLWAISLAENTAFQHLVRKAGLPFSTQTSHGEITTVITLSDL